MKKLLLVHILIALSRAHVLKQGTLENKESAFESVGGGNTREINDDLCRTHFNLYASAILQFEEWALNMFDATSKLQSGIMFGNTFEMGSFTQCLSILNEFNPENSANGEQIAPIRGKYCLGPVTGISLLGYKQKNYERFKQLQINVRQLVREGASLGDIGLYWAGCIPDSCSAALGSEIIGNFSLVGVQVQFAEELCTTKAEEPDITGGDIAVMCIFGLLLLLILVSTIYDLYLCKFEKKSAHPILLAFSGYTNSRKLFAITKSDEQLSCLNGIRVISLMWVILGHEYTTFVATPFANGVEVFEWLDSKYSMYAAGATVSVDSFFLLSGLLMSYGFLRAMSKGVKFNILTYYLHRYIRLTPALLGMILVHLTVLKHFGSGPFYKSYIDSDGCENGGWWRALIYLQNYIYQNKSDNICVGQSWYLAVDMQLFILSPIILLPLWKWGKKALGLVVLLIGGSIATTFAIAWVNKYPGSMLAADVELVNQAMFDIYIKTHCRASPWLIGTALGYFIYKYKTEKSYCNVNKVLSAVLTGLSLSVLCSCVFAGHDLYKKEYDQFENSAYSAFVRPSWGFALAWLIYACVIGHGGPINWFLSLPIYQVMGRFTYSMYLTHLTIMYSAAYTNKVPRYFSDYAVIHKFWGNFIFSFAVSYFWILMFESPMITIEKIIFGAGKASPKKSEQKEISLVHNNEEKIAY